MKTSEMDATRKQFSIIDRIERWLMSEPNTMLVRIRCLTTAVVLLAVCLYALARTGLFTYNDQGITASDISLAGTWKFRLEDAASFSSVGLDDSNWCLISVPDAGLAPVVGSEDHPSSLCPTDRYPRTAMRNRVYWYRKKFTISSGSTWREPALFLGAIKDKTWVYWDGKWIGTTKLETAPGILVLDPALVSVGPHELAVRVQTGDSLNPGIFHAYSKLVSVGEFAEVVTQVKKIVQGQQEQAVVSIVQLIALCILSFFIFRSGGVGEQFFWLLIYFGSACLYSEAPLIASDFQKTSEGMAFIGMSTAVAGYGNYVFGKGRVHRYFGSRVILATGVLSAFMQAFWAEGRPFDIWTVIISAAFVFIFGGIQLVTRRENCYSKTEMVTIASLLFLHGFHIYDRVITANNAVFFHEPFWTSVLTALVLVLAAEEHIQQVQLLAFFGRFIRPGLKQLLADFRNKSEEKHEWFRGRKIPLLKVDIVGYTDSTYQMPYGVKRLHHDLWYSYVDRVLEDTSFFDLPQGDGSIYCLSDKIAGGSCKAAVEAAEKIENEAIPTFDEQFKRKLELLLEHAPELKKPFGNFLAMYKNKNQAEFGEKKTTARFIFHYHWVDEGLWGLKTKSHYNVAGDSLIELTRLEKFVGDGEYLMTKSFYDQWILEDSSALHRYEFKAHVQKLKGIGDFSYITVRKKKQDQRAA